MRLTMSFRSFAPLVATLCLSDPVLAQTPPTPPTPPTATLLHAALHAKKKDRNLEASVRALFPADQLAAGAKPKADNTSEGITLAWAIEAPGLKGKDAPQVSMDDPTFPPLTLTRIGKSDLFAGTVFLPKGAAGNWRYVVGTETKATGRYEDYPINPEEKPQPGVPKGTLTQMPPWKSTVFAGTTRDWWVYVPAGIPSDRLPAVMVCQDGEGPKNWLPTVLDNLIAKGDIPPTVGIFLNPGKFEGGRSNRSVEYDTLSDTFARFLIEEILPEVEKTQKLSPNPDDRIIYGVSSGGICAFTVAWERPDAFRKVISAVGSFTNLQGGPTGVAGGNTYPAILRRRRGWNRDGQPKPIKVYLSDGANDLDNAAGSWPLANLEMDRALTYGGYEHRFVYGNGFHSDRFGRYLMPEALRYLWGRPDVSKP
ncbi:MAG: alpha/beta hydrolase-fold protein [Capsulimonadales bacterium]|nr:alpha/beta hydrolase-fold protein [Capsulimonadales bacterium]